MAVHSKLGGGEIGMMQEFLQQVENLVELSLNDIHTAMIGTILTYDPDSGMASVEPIASFLTEDGRKLPYPIISGVPVVMPKSEGYEIAFPVKSGERCLLIISEVDISPAVGAGEEDIPMRFDLTNAIAIPGIGGYRTDAGRKAISEDAVIIKTDKSEIIIRANEIRITAEKIILSGDLSIDGNMECSGSIKGGDK